jgi:hypothetical protein
VRSAAGGDPAALADPRQQHLARGRALGHRGGEELGGPVHPASRQVAARAPTTAQASAASTGPMWPAERRGAQPEIGTRARSTGPPACSGRVPIASTNDVSPANHTVPDVDRTRCPVAPLGRCGRGRAAWTATVSRTASGDSPPIGSNHPSAGGETPASPCRCSQPTFSGAVTTGMSPRSSASERRSAWSWCRWESSTRPASYQSCRAGGAPRRRSGPTWLRSNGSVSTRTPSTSSTTVECPSQVTSRVTSGPVDGPAVSR